MGRLFHHGGAVGSLTQFQPECLGGPSKWAQRVRKAAERWRREDTDLLHRAGLAPVRRTFLLGHKREAHQRQELVDVLGVETDVVPHSASLRGGPGGGRMKWILEQVG